MPSKKPKDVVLVHGRTKDGKGLGVLRAREDRLEIGTMRPLEEGKPLQAGGEIVKLTPRPEAPLVFDAETEFVAPAPLASERTDAAPRKSEPPAGSAGPPQVASDTYRKNWDAIWKRAGKRDKLVN